MDTSEFAKTADLASLKANIDKLDIDKLEKVQSGLSNLKSKVDKLDVSVVGTCPVHLSKLSDLVLNDFIKKTEYDELVKKVNDITTINTSYLLKKLTMTQKLVKLQRKYLIIIMIDILLIMSLMS